MLIFVFQHLHDGGVAVDVLASPSQMVCTTRLNYAESPAFIFRGTLMGDDKPAVNHISSVERCNVGNGAAGGVKEMRKDQAWIVKGRYNYDERPGNIEEGKQGAVSPTPNSFKILFAAFQLSRSSRFWKGKE